MITLSMIVKDEEKYLEGCLASVQNVVDEIVLVDTGSTDGTIEIAKKYHAKIFHFEWRNNFAAARNFALEQSTGNWILYLDADERLSKDSIAELKNLTKYHKRQAYKCIVKSISDARSPSVMAYTRLFPNERKIRFEGKVHEQIEIALVKYGIGIKISTILIEHYGYNISVDELKKKALRNINILLPEYEKEKSTYYAYHLASSYGIIEEKEKAVKYFTIVLQEKNIAKESLSIAARYIANHYATLQRFPTAIEYIEKSLQWDNEQPVSLALASKIYAKVGNVEAANNYCMKAYEANKKYSSGKKASNQTILMGEASLCYFGLETAVRSKNKASYNFFYQEYLSLQKSTESKELSLFNLLINNDPIPTDELSAYAGFIYTSNLDLVMTLLENYEEKATRLAIYELVKEKFYGNSEFCNRFGLFLMEAQKYSESVKILEHTIELNEENPSSYFYLVSAYLQNDETSKIALLIDKAEKKFADSEEVLSRLQLLKKKLPQIFF